MKLLIDRTAKAFRALHRAYHFVGGQLLTPRSRAEYAGQLYAIDNSAYSDFKPREFRGVLAKQAGHEANCLFVTLPDVVGSARRTLELFRIWDGELDGKWRRALVLQDGIEDFDLPWESISAVFVGGTTEFKMSQAAEDVIKAAKALELHTHVGRVNTPGRWLRFADLGVDTCDGTGLSIKKAAMDTLKEAIKHGESNPLLDSVEFDSGGEADCRIQRACEADST